MTMTDVQERRDRGSHRVSVSTLVEVCGNVPGIPVFEAESIDVSARGMHLKTAYLPETGAPLVCRFENDGGEIVVEGVVAWRREGSRGGEFGVQFTALDSRSVDALRELCGGSGKPEPREAIGGEPGARVRLHIDGLGSPMKARVRNGNSGKVQVGSNLEFLKVGRRLEIEDMDLGARRGAQIDGVSVIVDPSTQIPQLLVALRYEGSDDDTPSPTVAPAERKEQPEVQALRIPAEAVTMAAAPARSVPPPKPAKPSSSASPSANTASPAGDDTQADPNDDEPVLRGRVATLASNAEVHAKAAGEKLAAASSTAARGAARWFKGAAEKIAELGKNRGAKAVRRTTSPAPNGGVTTEKPRLRSQSAPGAASSEAPAKPRRLKQRTAVAIGVVSVIGIAGAAMALRSPSAPPPGASAAAAASAMATIDSLAPAEGAVPGGGVTADVPLFGSRPLSTTEPAPLGPAPTAGGDEQAELAEAKASLRSSSADDEEFAEEKPTRADRAAHERAEAKARDSSASNSEASPEDVAPWGRGRMHLPTIHRLRLDGPGAAIQGAAEPTGFTIVIPDRKVMEAAGGIAKRDPRIARVRATNIGAGAQVSFRFKDGVPGYRVRLRRDYIEFLVSAPTKSEEIAGKLPEAKKPAKSEKTAR
jgi:hypothetical protein